MSRYRCEVCDYVYDESSGEPREGFAPGTPWSQVPEDWSCPDCGVRDKVDFVDVDSVDVDSVDVDSVDVDSVDVDSVDVDFVAADRSPADG